jgi:2-polyprenyl-3-methyl-5-hydroxy-6-metoxy-1,4-benzoquinol methylase
MALLDKCLCGSGNSESDTINGIEISHCRDCGIKRQHLPNHTEKDYFDYYKNDYHTAGQEAIGLKSYHSRYAHDYGIAALRLFEYEKLLTLQKGLDVLDIGSSNNAFVDYMNNNGYQCKGVEIGEEGAKHPDTTYTKDLLELGLNYSSFDLITLHDVFEHLINPELYLKEIRAILKPKGFLIVDLPNYFVPEGLHHWRYIQHLWFFDEKQMTYLLNKNGFKVLLVNNPIKSKLVFYCQRI